MFLIRPTPYDDESLESFFIRLANLNGYDDVHRFLMATKRFLEDIDQSTFKTFPTDITRINPYSSQNNSTSRTKSFLQMSQMTFNEPVDLLKLAINRTNLKFSPSTSAVVRKAEVFPRSLLRSDGIPFCPYCLKENGFASYRWHFKGYDYCHQHNVALVTHCHCGAEYDYRKSGLKGWCSECESFIDNLEEENSVSAKLQTSKWLSGDFNESLPDVPISYRWGLIHWWENTAGCDFEASTFIEFFSKWPMSFHSMIEKELVFNLEHSVVHMNKLKVKDLLGKLFFSAIHLPDRNLQYNLVLCEFLNYLEHHLWDKDGLLANLRLNAFESAIFLNCSLDDIASMVEQGILKLNRRLKPTQVITYNNYLFQLSDIYSLWLAEFQTPEFNRSFYISRW